MLKTHIEKKFSLLIIFLLFHFSVCANYSLQNKNIRIGIIGSGPAGLVAAGQLQDKGYKNITLLEKEYRVGGKVYTVYIDGRPYDLGAVILSPNYKIILDIAAEVKEKTIPMVENKEILPNGQVRDINKYIMEKYGKLDLIKAFHRFHRFIKKHPKTFEHNIDNPYPETIKTVQDFSEDESIVALMDAIRPMMVGCGYGYAEKEGAYSWLKLMKIFGHDHFTNYFNPSSWIFNSGFYMSFALGWQNLWNKYSLKRNFNIQYGHEVASVRRSIRNNLNEITVKTTNGENFIFDRLIITTPHLASRFIDFLPKEKEVFADIETVQYKVSLVKIHGLPHKSHLWPREHSTQYNQEGLANDGNIVLMTSYHETDIYQVYQLSYDKDKTSSQLKEQMIENLQLMGHKINDGDILKEVLFDYYPHFNLEAVRAGRPNQLEKLQGDKGIYYTGSLLNFEIVERAAAHAKELIGKYF